MERVFFYVVVVGFPSKFIRIIRTRTKGAKIQQWATTTKNRQRQTQVDFPKMDPLCSGQFGGTGHRANSLTEELWSSVLTSSHGSCSSGPSVAANRLEPPDAAAHFCLKTPRPDAPKNHKSCSALSSIVPSGSKSRHNHYQSVATCRIVSGLLKPASARHAQHPTPAPVPYWPVLETMAFLSIRISCAQSSVGIARIRNAIPRTQYSPPWLYWTVHPARSGGGRTHLKWKTTTTLDLCDATNHLLLPWDGNKPDDSILTTLRSIDKLAIPMITLMPPPGNSSNTGPWMRHIVDLYLACRCRW